MKSRKNMTTCRHNSAVEDLLKNRATHSVGFCKKTLAKMCQLLVRLSSRGFRPQDKILKDVVKLVVREPASKKSYTAILHERKYKILDR